MSEQVFAEIDREVAAGRFWRAKEIMQGRLSSAAFDPALLEKYGTILLAMGDDLEAGRFLFASGKRKPEYEEALELFLSRNPASNEQQLMSALPAMVQRHRGLLKNVIASEEFRQHGYAKQTLERMPKVLGRKAPTPQPKVPLRLKVTLILAVVLLAACVVVGFVQILMFIITSLPLR